MITRTKEAWYNDSVFYADLASQAEAAAEAMAVTHHEATLLHQVAGRLRDVSIACCRLAMIYANES